MASRTQDLRPSVSRRTLHLYNYFLRGAAVIVDEINVAAERVSGLEEPTVSKALTVAWGVPACGLEGRATFRSVTKKKRFDNIKRRNRHTRRIITVTRV